MEKVGVESEHTKATISQFDADIKGAPLFSLPSY